MHTWDNFCSLTHKNTLDFISYLLDNFLELCQTCFIQEYLRSMIASHYILISVQMNSSMIKAHYILLIFHPISLLQFFCQPELFSSKQQSPFSPSLKENRLLQFLKVTTLSALLRFVYSPLLCAVSVCHRCLKPLVYATVFDSGH